MNYSALIEKQELFIHKITWMNLKGILLKFKKSVSKGYILYDSIYMTFSERQKHSDEELICGCQDLGQVEGDYSRTEWAFSGVYPTMLVVVTCVKFTQLCNKKDNFCCMLIFKIKKKLNPKYWDEVPGACVHVSRKKTSHYNLKCSFYQILLTTWVGIYDITT